MTMHRRNAIGFLTAILLTGLAATGWAQEEKKTPKPTPKPAASAAKPAPAPLKPRDPAVEAILATNPRTPVDWARAARIMADLDEFELAKGFLKKILGAKLDEKQLADLGDSLGSAVFTRMAARSELAPEAKSLSDAVLAAVNRQLQAPERITALVGQLRDPSEEVRSRAVAGLREAGAAAVAPLVAVLADPKRKAEHAAARSALAQLGSDAARPLVGCLSSSDTALVVEVIEALAESGERDATVWLLAPLASPKSDPAVRQAAQAAIERLVGQTPSRDEAAKILVERAGEYFDGRRAVRKDADDQVAIWRWDSAKKQSVATHYPADVAAVVIAARLAEDAVSISPNDEPIRQLWLLTVLEQAAYENGLDKPLDMAKGTPAARAAECGVDAIQRALDRAMATGHMPAATAAARILGRIGTAEKVLAGNAEPLPLARAVRSADRRLRFAALEAILSLQPARTFPGSSYVPEALAFFSAATGRRRAMVAGPITEDAMRIGGLLTELGYQADTAVTGREMLDRLVAAPDYELVLIDSRIQQPPISLLVQQLRHDARTAGLPVGVLGTADDSERARLAAREDRLTEAMTRPHDKQAVQWQVERLKSLAGRAAVSAEERRRQAAQTLRWIAELSAEPHPIYDLGQAEGSAMAVLHSPELGAQAVAVLEQMGTPASQRALVDLASRRTQPLALRKVAVAAFVTSIQRHGVLLTTKEILAQYDRYNESATADAETQHILGRILDTLEAPTKSTKPQEK